MKKDSEAIGMWDYQSRCRFIMCNYLKSSLPIMVKEPGGHPPTSQSISENLCGDYLLWAKDD